MRETWYYIFAEFRALGLRCVFYGPEFWLVFPLGLGVIVAAVLVGRDILRGGRKRDRR